MPACIRELLLSPIAELLFLLINRLGAVSTCCIAAAMCQWLSHLLIIGALLNKCEYLNSVKTRLSDTDAMQELQLLLSQAAQCMLCPTLKQKVGDIPLGAWLTRHTMQELLPWLLLAGKHTHAGTQLRHSLARTVSIQTHYSAMSTQHCHMGHHMVACMLCLLANLLQSEKCMQQIRL